MFDQGFCLPKENWSKLPHQLIEHLHIIEKLSELKVVLYILRHTWGYQEWEDYQAKAITIDEFEYGRKKRDGTRMDKGIGMSRPSIVTGLKEAETHGFVVCLVDNTDLGRVTNYFRLRYEGEPLGRVYAIDPQIIEERRKQNLGIIPSWHWLTKEQRQVIYARFGGRCAYCEAKSTSWHYDHIYPRSRGGVEDVDNIALACPPCNLSKRALTPDEWGHQVIIYDEHDTRMIYRGWEKFAINGDGVKKFNPPQLKNLTPPSKESLPRSEKDTKERNQRKIEVLDHIIQVKENGIHPEQVEPTEFDKFFGAYRDHVLNIYNQVFGRAPNPDHKAALIELGRKPFYRPESFEEFLPKYNRAGGYPYDINRIEKEYEAYTQGNWPLTTGPSRSGKTSGPNIQIDEHGQTFLEIG